MSVAVVTGASRGLGRGVAVALADGGFDVVVGYRSDEQGAKETAVLVERAGRTATTVAGDVSEEATHERLLAAARTIGALDVWVNNAGVSVLVPVVAMARDQLDWMLRVNVTGAFLGLRTATRAMLDAGQGGCIVNVASELGVQGCRLLGGYAATKFAVVGLSQSAALELAADRIRVNAVCPGTAETDMVAAERAAEVALGGQSLGDVRAAGLGVIPAGRFCTPEDVGGLVAYLASPAAAFVTGQSICVNGGAVLR